MQGHYDTLYVVVLVVPVAPGIPRSPIRRGQHQQQQLLAVRFPHTYMSSF